MLCTSSQVRFSLQQLWRSCSSSLSSQESRRSTSSSKEFSPTTDPVSSSSFPSTYSFTPSTEQSQVALPVLMIAGCIVGTCLCGMALAANHMWRSKTKTRPKRNEQPVENQQRVSAHETLDWELVIVYIFLICVMLLIQVSKELKKFNKKHLKFFFKTLKNQVQTSCSYLILLWSSITCWHGVSFKNWLT